MNKISEENYRSSLEASLRSLQGSRRALEVSLQDHLFSFSDPSSEDSLTSRVRQLNADVSSLKKLRRERLDATAPLIAKYNTIVSKLSRLKVASNEAIGSGGGDEVSGGSDNGGGNSGGGGGGGGGSGSHEAKIYPSLSPDNYVVSSGRQILEDIISKHEEELVALEKEEAKLAEENSRLMEALSVTPSELQQKSANSKIQNAQLNEIKKRRANDLKELGETIGRLWSELEIPSEERMAFQTKVKMTGLKLESKATGEAEVKRLREIKASRQLSELNAIRDEIRKLWGMCGYSDEQKAKFKSFTLPDTTFEDGALPEHKSYLAALQQEFESKKHILLLIQKYKQLARARQDLFDIENSDRKILERKNSAVEALDISKR